MTSLILEIPNETHRQEYARITNKWEQLEDNIQPELMRRGKASYERWLEYCEDDRTTGSMLSTHVPCTLYFALNEQKEIVGGIVLNHEDTNADIFMQVLFRGAEEKDMVLPCWHLH
ncbi:MAG TPA: hypothetical protein GXZ23_03590 [Clostridiales bacterium]|nr:hypothetical protein [Clostridiales bacterium]